MCKKKNRLITSRINDDVVLRKATCNANMAEEKVVFDQKKKNL